MSVACCRQAVRGIFQQHWQNSITCHSKKCCILSMRARMNITKFLATLGIGWWHKAADSMLCCLLTAVGYNPDHYKRLLKLVIAVYYQKANTLSSFSILNFRQKRSMSTS